MAANRVHFRTARGTGRARSACGRMINANYLSMDPVDVTCVKCKETGSYRHALRNRPAVANIASVDPAIKAALDKVFEAANQIAEDAGLCSQYEDVIEEIAGSGALPNGYDIPGRERKWDIQINRSYVDATSLEEAKAEVMKNFDTYFYISAR